MFWPLILPLKITFWTLTLAVIAVTAWVPLKKWTRGRHFLVSLSMAIILAVPLLIGTTYIVDVFRFGKFEFETFDDVNDFRAERYLPAAASQIRMQKHADGYQARYVISQTDFHDYLEHLWDEYGESSATRRDELAGDQEPASPDEIAAAFSDPEWTPPEHAVQYHSPIEADGGGATYYFDSEAGIAYQQTFYW